jgi:hypothetical protein
MRAVSDVVQGPQDAERGLAAAVGDHRRGADRGRIIQAAQHQVGDVGVDHAVPRADGQRAGARGPGPFPPGDARRPDHGPVQTTLPNGVGHCPRIGDERPAAQPQHGQDQLAAEIVRVTGKSR